MRLGTSTSQPRFQRENRDQIKEPIGTAKYQISKYHVAAWRALDGYQSVARAPIKDEEAEVKRLIKDGQIDDRKTSRSIDSRCNGSPAHTISTHLGLERQWARRCVQSSQLWETSKSSWVTDLPKGASQSPLSGLHSRI